MQRSRFGSNTFGVRVDLNSPLSTSETTKYVHVLVYKPNTSKVMLVGLGKRESFTEEPTDIEQFWVESNYSMTANQWCDMVFPIKTVTGVKVYSFVIVPDLASPHALTQDYACYIDQIEVNSSSSQRRGPFTSSGGTVEPDPEPTDEVYSVNFDKTQTNTRESGSASGKRYLKGVSLKCGIFLRSRNYRCPLSSRLQGCYGKHCLECESGKLLYSRRELSGQLDARLRLYRLQ